jgi:glycosyltransferase involved in cell wall biosynthesis/ribosomal 50S subunit-associated protein YjgA (DUF615 family)
MTQPLVSVCIITYQHFRFIAQAIEGALMQICDFPFEILIGEDESTDGTREICLEYARRHPNRIRVFLRDRSDVVHIDGLPRGSYNFRMTLGEARGEFIALCEGDDFWTDPSKLQRQVDFLRANPDCVGCFHDAQLVDGDGLCLQESYLQEEADRFTQAEVLGKLLSRQPTCSMVFRKSAFSEPLPEWYLRRPSDLYLDILITGQGSLGFIRRNMSAYRKHAAGIWSGQREAKQVLELIIRYKLLLSDPFFLSRYRDLILSKIEEFQSLLFTPADFDAETARLAAIVEEQAIALASIGRERDRLTDETKAAHTEVNWAFKEGQKHIDALTAQLDRLAATSSEQTRHIKVLEAERDRLTAETKAAQTEASRAFKEGQKYIDALTAQLNQLATTSSEQTKHIKVLEAERDRLTAETKAAQTEAQRAAKDGQKHIDALTAQLNQLAATSAEQTKYIKVLEAERDRLTAETNVAQRNSLAATNSDRSDLTDLRQEVAHYLAVIKEQTDYIKALEVVRDQNSGKSQ